MTPQSDAKLQGLGAHYRGPHLELHASNGGAYLLTRALLLVAQESAHGEAENRVVTFLQSLQLAGTQSVFDFDVDPRPESLDADCVHFLAGVSGELATRLAANPTNSELASLFQDNRERHIRWAAWFVDFAEMINATLPPERRIVLQPNFGTDHERLLFERTRIHHQLTHLGKTGGNNTAEYALVCRELRTYDDHAMEDQAHLRLWLQVALERRAELGAALGYFEEAATDYTRAAGLESDTEVQDFLLELAEAAREGDPIL